MKTIAGIVKSTQKFKKYELIILSINEIGHIFFNSSNHFSRFSLQSEKDVYKEILDNKIINVIVDEELKAEFKEMDNEIKELGETSGLEVYFKSIEQSYLTLNFVNTLSQIRKDSDLWKVQIQDKLRSKIRGIDGPCDGVYSSDMIDGFVLALTSSIIHVSRH